ncbi:hypothetical protein [Chlorogloeopsis sp. ULAP02]
MLLLAKLTFDGMGKKELVRVFIDRMIAISRCGRRTIILLVE